MVAIRELHLYHFGSLNAVVWNQLVWIHIFGVECVARGTHEWVILRASLVESINHPYKPCIVSHPTVSKVLLGNLKDNVVGAKPRKICLSEDEMGKNGCLIKMSSDFAPSSPSLKVSRTTDLLHLLSLITIKESAKYGIWNQK